MALFENGIITVNEEVDETNAIISMLEEEIIGVISEHCLAVLEGNSEDGFILSVANQKGDTNIGETDVSHGDIEDVLGEINKVFVDCDHYKLYNISMNPKITYLSNIEKYYAILNQLIVFRCTNCKDKSCKFNLSSVEEGKSIGLN